ncbi:DUF6114 domain-containing protein [Streptomyces sp. WMMC1477]|uniref:DUF6114 domain-containing protein n=1 Tax=Streptomyces sp. WMMC1477 TaxID=3015155 RepID=UPI0022B74D0A|nr:DUF6114 domain-containing protein [Streptomyces sp. WMMC1477]MCZ7433731.1 DUF6114 domain-containing protein [Streptomyces sp. WMMC1477]
MSAESPGLRGRLTDWRLRFRAWRRSRPFWAGLLTLLGGLPIAYFPYANLNLGHMTLTMATTAGAGSLIIGVLLVTLGLTMWFQQVVRVFAGVAAILLALISIPISNLGGFFMGFLLALVGGALSVSWAPHEPADESGEDDGEDPARTSATPAGDAEDQAPEPAATERPEPEPSKSARPEAGQAEASGEEAREETAREPAVAGAEPSGGKISAA